MKLFDEIPRERPATPLLDSFDHPAALRAMSPGQLAQLADELRAYLLYSVGVTGGHFGAGLGVVELSVALHHAFHTPQGPPGMGRRPPGLPPQDSHRPP